MAFAALETTPVGTRALRAGLDRTMACVETSLARACPTSGGRSVTLQSALRHHLGTDGQRLRARLCAETALVLDLGEADATALASCCELLHNAGLLLNDLRDRTANRRGQPAVWAAFDDDVAVELSESLTGAAFASLARLGMPGAEARTVPIAHEAALRTAAGRQAVRDSRARSRLSVTQYLDAARAKTAPLVSLALELPLAAHGFAGSLPQARQAAGAYATAYHILGDLRDVEADRASGDRRSLNGVQILERLGAKRPFADAVSLARGHLTLCRAAASRLPSGSGTPLVEAAWALDGAFRRNGHG